MAIYHLQAKIVSRGGGRSAVAASAYMSCSHIVNEYDGVEHDYTRKGGLVWEQVLLPSQAPEEWQDRGKLWNAVEENEKTRDSRLAREFVVALPIEMTHQQQISLTEEFVRENFVAQGMCADMAIHDTDGHNPHAHIMLTVRPLDEEGKWQYKSKKEYLCIRDGEEKGFTAEEFKSARKEGWEKQYLYSRGDEKVYLASSAAGDLERASKTPKSTRFGRQNPISEKWNSEEQLVQWREAWAEVTNRHLEQIGSEARIDHRSLAEQGIDRIPTVHEGVTARAMEQQGQIADRCEINRKIKASNKILTELRLQLEKMLKALENTVPAIAEALETLRDSMIVLRCHFLENTRKISDMLRRQERNSPIVQELQELKAHLKEKSAEKKSLSEELKACGPLKFLRSKKLKAQLATLTEEMEDLKNRRAFLQTRLGCEEKEAEKDLRNIPAGVELLQKENAVLETRQEKELAEYRTLRESVPKEEQEALSLEQSRLRAVHDQAQIEKTLELPDGPAHLELHRSAQWSVDQDLRSIAPKPAPRRRKNREMER